MLNRRPARPAGRLALAATLTTSMLLAIAPAAEADVGATIINRCTHGQSITGFTQQAYRRALQEMPTEVEEYSDCANLIRRAELAAAGGGGQAGGGGATPLAPTPLTVGERKALKRLSRRGPTPVRVGNQVVRPGVVHADVASALSTLPTPLLAMLALLVACALALGGRTVRDRVRARRSS